MPASCNPTVFSTRSIIGLPPALYLPKKPNRNLLPDLSNEDGLLEFPKLLALAAIFPFFPFFFFFSPGSKRIHGSFPTLNYSNRAMVQRSCGFIGRGGCVMEYRKFKEGCFFIEAKEKEEIGECFSALFLLGTRRN